MATRRRARHLAVLTSASMVAFLILVLAGGPLRAATVTQSAGCFSPVTSNWSTLPLQISGEASLATIETGQTFQITGTSIVISVDSSLIAAGVGAGVVSEGTNSVVSTVQLRLGASNTSEGTQSVGGVTDLSFDVTIDGDSGVITVDPDPVVGTVGLEDSTWTASAPGQSVVAVAPGTPPAGAIPTIPERNSAPIQILNRLNDALNANFFCWPGSASAEGNALVPGSTEAIATVAVEGDPDPTTPDPTTPDPTTPDPTTPDPTTPDPTTPDPTVPEPDLPNVGSARYEADCTNTITPDIAQLVFEVSAEAPFQAQAGDTIVLTQNRWRVEVPSSVLDTGIALGLLSPGDFVSGTIRAGVAGTNTVEGVVSFPPVAIGVGPIEIDADGFALPASAEFEPPDLAFTAMGGGNVDFSLAFATVDVAIGPIELTFDCTPNVLGLAFVSTEVTGDPIAVPTPVAATPAPEGPIVAPATQTAEATGVLPATGAPGVALQVLVALALIDFGYLGWSATRPGPARRRRRR
jgi:hypothetical protein